MTDGFLIVDKPAGLTSHDVVARVRRETGVKRVGHAGTLDPMATGVVVVALGRVTRLIRFLQDLDKEYVATAMFGVATDSLDADGSEIARMDMEVTPADLERIRPRFLGVIDQVPPMVSALKKDGKRLYELAREGVEVEREPRPVVIHELEILAVGDGPQPLVSFRVRCGKGTYVRSLADDMARALGGYAHLTSLRRTRTGHLTLDQAVDDLAAWADHLVSPADGMAMFSDLNLDEEEARVLRNGRPVGASEGLAGRVRALDPSGTLIAVCTIEGGVARPEVVVG